MMESKQVTVGICFAMLSIGVDAQISYKEDRVLYCMDKLAAEKCNDDPDVCLFDFR
tara:strand:+ start:16 stop:183 length:168 start_codon:yes stop_codon:yes gene_type:complete